MGIVMVKSWPLDQSWMTERDRVVIEYTRSSVKIKFKLINFKNNSRIEGYNGK